MTDIVPLPAKIFLGALVGVGIIGAVAEFFSPIGPVNIVEVTSKPQLEQLLSTSQPGQLVVVNYGSYKYEPCIEMRGPYEHYSRIYPECAFIFVDMLAASNIGGIVHIPTFKLYRDNKVLETVVLNGADPDKLQKTIEKHLPGATQK